jgi:peptidoglycan/xylan/chitin deacetylase (PgdA/CDA1 family)
VLASGVVRFVGRALPVDVVWFVQTPARAVALTFDDGPDPSTTPALLEVLAKHGAQATFFLIGSRAREHPDLVARIVSEGHEIANHSMSDRPSISLTADEFERDLLETHATLSAHGPVRLFRPASGWFGPRMLRVVGQQGYRCVLGDVTILDAQSRQPYRQAQAMLRRARRGSIIILHEGDAGRVGVADLTDHLVSGLTARGLAVRSVSALDLELRS